MTCGNCRRTKAYSDLVAAGAPRTADELIAEMQDKVSNPNYMRMCLLEGLWFYPNDPRWRGWINVLRPDVVKVTDGGG